MNYDRCSVTCYKHLTRETFGKKSALRRPIISLIHRSMINLAIDIFSYDPCLIFLWIGKENTVNGNKEGLSLQQQANRGLSCENVYFYLIEEYELGKKLNNKLYKN